MSPSPDTTLDHLVVAGATLAQAIEHFADLTGVVARPGGRHATMGTHNALVRLGPKTYVELIAIDPDATPPTRPRWFDLDDATPYAGGTELLLAMKLGLAGAEHLVDVKGIEGLADVRVEEDGTLISKEIES